MCCRSLSTRQGDKSLFFLFYTVGVALESTLYTTYSHCACTGSGFSPFVYCGSWSFVNLPASLCSRHKGTRRALHHTTHAHHNHLRLTHSSTHAHIRSAHAPLPPCGCSLSVWGSEAFHFMPPVPPFARLTKSHAYTTQHSHYQYHRPPCPSPSIPT